MVTESVTCLEGSEKELSRTARLLELLIRVQTKPRFTAAELAEEFGVSRRTMLRALSALSAMGVPLRSTTGLAAVTKLRAALPKDVVAQLDRLRRHVFVGGPVREYEAPLLGELLSAALDRVHLKVTYDSIESGVTERVIFPYGLYASQGYWYCVCFDRRRKTNVPMRADRFLAAERVEGFESPPELSIPGWMGAERGADERIQVRARVTERGRKSFELASLFGRIEAQEGGGSLEAEIPRSEIAYYASRLLSVGTEIFVDTPPELVEAIQNRAREVIRLYGSQST